MKTFLWVISVILSVVTLGCSKNSDIVPEDVLTKFPPPAWKTDETGKYPFSMTAVVTIPSKLSANMDDGDKLAAFVNDECRGEGVAVKVNSTNVFFVLIHGLADEHGQVIFKYYSAKSSYLYKTGPVLNFLVDDVYGTAQNPKILDLNPIQ
ncbi:MAG TPA: hypothetical protein VLJ41_15835 [Segetibacter sp.]|nr:hypothetical protein [Segetibacter sp.]